MAHRCNPPREPDEERFYGESPHKIGSNTTVIFGIIAWTLLGLMYHYVAISRVRAASGGGLWSRNGDRGVAACSLFCC